MEYEETIAFQMAMSKRRQQCPKGRVSTSQELPAWAVDYHRSVE